MLFIQIILAIIIYSILGYVLYVVIRYGKLRVVTKIKYTYFKTSNRLKISYKKFNGFDYYYFRFKKDEPVTIHYEVRVEEGSLLVEIRDFRDVLYSETFTEDKKGTIELSPKMRLHSIKVDGKKTKGGCEFTLIR